MAAACTVAFGIFSDRISTENAIQALRSAGFRNADIFALFPDDIPTKKFSSGSRRRVVQGAATGGGTAVVLGGVLEWLAGAGILTVAGLGALLSIGTGGGFIGAWAGNRTSDYERRYEARVRRGDILISVQCVDSQGAKRARDILKRAGGDDVSSATGLPVDVGLAARATGRPVVERTIAPPLRLVTSRAERPDPGLTVHHEPQTPAGHRKSAAS